VADEGNHCGDGQVEESKIQECVGGGGLGEDKDEWGQKDG